MYRIRPIRCGTLTSHKDALTLKLDRDQRVVFPVLAFLLVPDDDGPTVLVDTGVKPADDPYIQRRGKEVGPPGGGPGPLVEGLEAANLTPDDVDVVVLTHLHHDHASNVELFPDAEVLLQRAELEAARDPLPVFAETYPRDSLEALARLNPTLVEGTHYVAEGIELLHTPGHTEGSQSVVVGTRRGPHALVSDLAYNRHNLEPGRSAIVDATGRTIETTSVEFDYVPPGTVVDVAACYRSIARLRERVGPDGVMLPGHDAELAAAYPGP